MKNHRLAPVIAALVMLGVAISFAACAGAEVKKSDLNDRVLIVDVRTPAEFEGEHFPGAVNIPYDEVANRLDEFGDKEGPIIVYCRSGRRSGIAQSILVENGFTNVKNGGGLGDMKKTAGE